MFPTEVLLSPVGEVVMSETHLHLVVTHVPVIGILLASGVLAVGFWMRQEVLQKTGLVLLLVAGLGAGGAYLTGEGAEEDLEARRAVPETLVDRHEDVAALASIGMLVVALAAAGALAAARRRPLSRGVVAAVLIGAVIVSGALAYAANLGGQIGHPEIRSVSASSQ
jgi:uncharacterized membrane protein